MRHWPVQQPLPPRFCVCMCVRVYRNSGRFPGEVMQFEDDYVFWANVMKGTENAQKVVLKGCKHIVLTNLHEG